MKAKGILAELFLNKLFPKFYTSHLEQYFEVTYDPDFFSCVTCIYLLFVFSHSLDVRATISEKTVNSAANGTGHLFQCAYF